MPKLKKLLLSFIVSLLLFTVYLSPLLVKPAVAQTAGTWYNQSYKEWWNKVYKDSADDEIFGERYTAAQVQWVIFGLFSFVLNSTSDPETTSCLMNSYLNDCVDRIKTFLIGIEKANNALAGEKKGFLAFMASDRPLSGITYIKNVARKINIVPEAYAQTGFGFNALDPILPLWRAVRNATYALLVVATLAMAFMIMFRVKISPQTVISIQSALPKLVGAIILITFSYAIAGLLVDLMYVVIGFLAVTLSSAINVMGWSPTNQDLFGFMTRGIADFGVFSHILIYMFLFGAVVVPTFMGAAGVGGPLGILAILPGFLAAIFAILTIIILLIVLFVVFFRVIWMLIKAFANVFLLVLTAPLQILLGTVSPGGGIGPWIRSYLANLAVFPTTAVLFVLSYIFLILALTETWRNQLAAIGGLLSSFGLGSPTGPIGRIVPGWPPLLSLPIDNLVGVLFLFVSVVVITLIPRVNEIIQGLITGKPFAYGTAIGEAFGPFGKAYGATVAPFAQGYMRQLGEKQVTEETSYLNRKLTDLRNRLGRKPKVT